METLELDDIQGYIISGYKHMIHSRYVLLQVTDSEKAKEFIRSIIPEVTTAVHRTAANSLNIAFTASGLRALGLKDVNMQNFTRAFREGMTSEHRQRLLGDYDSSAPGNWRWGGPLNEDLDIILMIFGADIDGVATMNYYNRLKEQFAPGLRELRYSFSQEPIYLDGVTLPGNREHFGFRDGISQPIIKGSGRPGPAVDHINAGEFLMGYKNEYGVYPDTPIISEDQGNVNLLPADVAGTGCKDLGKNGSYMVLRQLEQHVNTFWTFLNEQTKNPDGSYNYAESDKLAAKMMGRWRCGMPIGKSPDVNPDPDDDPAKACDDNDYNYSDDKEGLKCPFGSHMRRGNPRDTFEDDGPKKSVKLTNRHRIIRRARLYGVTHLACPTRHEPEGEVGLIFTCFNSDIARQFEFIQYTWGNYPKVKHLYNDPDPIIGVREKPEPGVEQNFTIQVKPVNKYITDIPSFVTVRGGAYFFFPSITSIRYLTTID